ncbi:MAG: DUF2203 domain-containing protein [Elusimicrobia bacterium]|nr:DUF2203 domain-containing protein [Elusimicrobiota bacterium]
MRYFTHSEAEGLLPKIRRIMDNVIALRERAKAKAQDYERLSKLSNAGIAGLAILKGQIDFLLCQIEEQLKEVGSLGAVPKGIDPCLIDFPCRLDDQEIYLCWRYGEELISHYHGLDEDFSGRKLLPASVFYQS